jgi:molybdate transport system substrate-binding protein
MTSRRTFTAGLAALLLTTAPAFADDGITVLAAASLKTALDGVNAAWLADTQKRARISYAATPALAKQVQEGAPADVFISADEAWMKTLVDGNLIAPDSVVKLLGNDIVLVAPADSTANITIAPGFDLAGALGDGKLAMADVKAVPAGKYGKAALENLGAWAGVESKVAQAENVRAALKLVATGEAAMGIVYATDARAEAGVKVLGLFPAESHPPIIYPVGRVAASQNPDAAAFITFLQSAKAQAIFKAQGFTLLVPPAN